MAEKLGDAILELRTDDSALDAGIKRAQSKSERLGATFDRVGKRSMQMGKNLSLGLTAPLGLMAAAAVKGARKQAMAVAQVDAALESMGDQAGFTSQQLQDMASKAQGNSLFGDDDILNGVTANLLTFGNISDDVFSRTQQMALDLSARLDQDLQSSAVMLGKALNDPATGLTALTRVGITFSEQQKDQIKAMVKAGDTAGAQALMLSELERQYGGQAAAAAKADGGVTQLANSWGDMQEEFGAVILELMPAFISGASSVVGWLQSLDQDTKKWVLGIGLALVAAGPLLMGFGLMASGIGAIIGPLGLLFKGLSLLGPVIGIVGKALLGLLANPVVLAAAALIAGIYLAWQNWDKIKPIIDRVGAAVTQWWNSNVKPVLDKVMPLLRAITDFFRDYFGAGIEGVVKVISALLKGDFAGAWEAAKASVSKMVSAAIGLLNSLAPNAISSLRALYAGAKQWLQDKLGAVFDWLQGRLEAVGGWFFDLYDKVVGNSYVPDMVARIGEEMAKLEKLMVDPAQRATKSTKEAFRQLASDVAGLLDRLFPAQAQIRDIMDDLAKLDAMLKAGGISPELHAAAVGKLENERRQILWDEQVESNGGLERTPFPEIKAGFEGLKDIIADLPRIATEAEVELQEFGEWIGGGLMGALHGAIEGKDFFDSIKNLFQRTMQNILHDALSNLETAIFGKGGLGGALGNALGSIFAGGFATGGLIPTGQFGVVGERGPEPVISTPRGAKVIPNSSLRSMMSGSGSGPAPINHFDLRGALVTQDVLDQMNAISRENTRAGIAGYDQVVGERVRDFVERRG